MILQSFVPFLKWNIGNVLLHNDSITKMCFYDTENKIDELKILRREQSQLAIEKLKVLLIDEYPKSRDGSQKRKAILYIQKRWKGFTLFIDDTRIPLSNNEAERTIRHAFMGRKNYYGSGNQAGAVNSNLYLID